MYAASLGIVKGYEDGEFKPGKTLKRSEMAVVLNRIAALLGAETNGFDAEVAFADVADHWCKAELGWPVHTGIVKGTSDTTFSPENTLTREQTIVMVYRTLNAFTEAEAK